MKKPSENSIHIAAQCWCDEETRMIEMDTRLANAFAKRLDGFASEAIDLVDILESCFNQACQVRWDEKMDLPIFDHMCISSYENAQQALIELGRIKPEQCTRGV